MAFFEELMSGGIKKWPADERPREKLLKVGAENLTEAELLALVIRTGDATAKKSAVDLGRDILIEFGSLERVSTTSLSELCRIHGCGDAKAASLSAAFELGKRVSKVRFVWEGEKFTSPEQIFNYFQPKFSGLKKERFFTVLLDTKNRITREILVSEGSLTQSIVHPREVFVQAVKDSAAAVILVHNHPSGDPNPSPEDREITRRLKDAGDLLGIRVLDHVVVGTRDYYSFNGMGQL